MFHCCQLLRQSEILLYMFISCPQYLKKTRSQRENSPRLSHTCDVYVPSSNRSKKLCRREDESASKLWAFLHVVEVSGFMQTQSKILKSTVISDITASQLPWRPSKVFVPFAKEYFYRGAYWHLITSPRQRCFNKRTQLTEFLTDN